MLLAINYHFTKCIASYRERERGGGGESFIQNIKGYNLLSYMYTLLSYIIHPHIKGHTNHVCVYVYLYMEFRLFIFITSLLFSLSPSLSVFLFHLPNIFPFSSRFALTTLRRRKREGEREGGRERERERERGGGREREGERDNNQKRAKIKRDKRGRGGGRYCKYFILLLIMSHLLLKFICEKEGVAY